MAAKPKFAAHTPPQERPDDWHLLSAHLHKVANRAKGLAQKFGAGDLAYYAGLWHDLGKYNPKFQQYLKQCHEGIDHPKRIPHAIYGAILADEVCADNIAPLIYGHHAGLPNYGELDGILGDFLDNPNQEALYQQIIDSADHEIEIDLSDSFEDCIKHLEEYDQYSREVFDRMLFSCLIDADRLDTEAFGSPDQAASRKARSHLKIEQLWQVFSRKQKEFVQEQAVENGNSIVFQVQQEVYAHCLDAALKKPGIFRLTVPTGGGKTLSGIAFALKHATPNKNKNPKTDFERVIVAVPYTSIIEQTVGVYREIFEEELGEGTLLEHHSAVKSDLQVKQLTDKNRRKDSQEELDEGAKQGQWQARLATQNWDAPLIITTTVQLFESLFSHRPSKCRKLHNIVGSVIILDEVQALPIALRIPICNMLEELVKRYQVSIVLCTATQPVLEGSDGYFQGFSADFIHDIIPPDKAKQHFQKLQRVNYDLSPIKTGSQWSWTELAKKIRQHDQALVILNTRKDALKTLMALPGTNPNVIDLDGIEEKVESALQQSPILHLSTLLCGAHRQKVLDEIRDRLKHGKPCILVSTQVVEAGVDLDFPAVYRALGPLDRIVQAAGRCNRKGKLEVDGTKIPGQVTVFELEDGSTPPKSSEYAKLIEITRSTLQRCEAADLHKPDIFDSYGRSAYKVEPSDKHRIQGDRAGQNYRKVSEKFRLIEDVTVPVVVKYNHEVEALLQEIKHRGLWSSDYRTLQPYTVSVRRWEFQKHRNSIKEWQADFYVWNDSYDPIQGLPLLGDPSDAILLDIEQLTSL
ncbi:MAG: CRISPR-associated helicase Cas3' [Leptolyngbyaceae cyanobacterium]